MESKKCNYVVSQETALLFDVLRKHDDLYEETYKAMSCFHDERQLDEILGGYMEKLQSLKDEVRKFIIERIEENLSFNDNKEI